MTHTDTLGRIALLAAAMRAHDQVHAVATCGACGATWDADEGPECRWCAETAEREREDARAALLWPDWLRIARHAGYLACSETDRRIWAQTRGIAHMEGAARFWAERLRRGVESGLITKHEADLALGRAAKAIEAAAA